MIDHSTDKDVAADDDEAAQRRCLRWLRLQVLKSYARRSKKSKAEKMNEANVHNERTNTPARSS